MIGEVRTTAFWQAVCCLAGSCSKTFLSWSLRIKDSEKNDWVVRTGKGDIKSSRQNGIILRSRSKETLRVLCHVNLGHNSTITTQGLIFRQGFSRFRTPVSYYGSIRS